MRRRLLWISIALLLSVPGTGFSESIALRWDYAGPQAAITWRTFYTRMKADNTVTQGEAVLHEIDAAQCQAVSRTTACTYEGNELLPYRPGTTHCGTMACPGPGAYTFGLRANDSEISANPADLAAIGFNEQCQCIAFRDAILGTATPAPPPTAAPDTQPPPQDPQPAVPTPTPPATATPTPTPAPEDPPVTSQPVPVPTPRPQPAPGATSGTNLVTAPTAQQPWRSGSYAGTQTQTGLDTTMQREGRPAQKLTGRGDYFAQTTSAPFSVESGRTYDVAAWVKLQGITQLVEVDVFYWDAQGKQLRAWGEAIGGRLQGTHDWTRLAGQVTAPPEAVTAVVQVRVMSHEGTAWVDNITMQARQAPGVGLAVPPPEVAPTPAQPRLPEKPAAPVPLPKPIPAQTRQGLLDQFAVLEREYQAAQQAIRATYDALLQRLAKAQTPAAQQEREQAHTVGTKALNDLYQVLLGHWQTLAQQWEVVT